MLDILRTISAWFLSRFRSERGASLVEYALLMALIVCVCIGAISFLGQRTGGNAQGGLTNSSGSIVSAN
jgi:Flp pilus assembly pilin Flp